MEFTFETILYLLFLIDAVLAVVVSFSGEGRSWFNKNFRIFSRYFPPSKGWSLYYLLLILFIGKLLY